MELDVQEIQTEKKLIPYQVRDGREETKWKEKFLCVKRSLDVKFCAKHRALPTEEAVDKKVE